MEASEEPPSREMVSMNLLFETVLGVMEFAA
jgi:hypothetical protein